MQTYIVGKHFSLFMCEQMWGANNKGIMREKKDFWLACSQRG